MKTRLTPSRRIISIICLLLLFSISISQSFAQPAKWTIMVYLDADNNLEDASIIDFNEMEAVGSTDGVNIIVQFDRIDGFDETNGNWTDTRRFRVLQDANTSQISTSPIEIMGEQNMGDPAVLTDFITWSVTNYPADRYSLILWNHGGGMWKKDGSKGKDNPADKDVCWDDTDGDYLTNYEVGQAIANSGIHLDMVGYDACLMGMIEVAFQIRDVADVMVASEETIPWDGYDYTGFLEELVSNPDMNAATLADYIVDTYGAYYVFDDVTIAAIDLHNIRNVANKLDTLTSRIIENDTVWDAVGAAWENTQSFADWSYRDIWSFANQINIEIAVAHIQDAANELMSSIDDAVLSNYATGNYPYAKGISIYFPDSYTYDSEYENPMAARDFPDSSLWVDFLHAFHTEFYNDYTEPNNHFASATIGYGYSSAVGALKDSSDIDIYRVFCYGEGDASVTLNTLFDIDMYLYTVVDTLITKIDSSTNTGAASELISLAGRDTGYYYILLKPVETGEQLYSLNFDGYLSAFDFYYGTPATAAYDDGIPDNEFYSTENETGVGMVFSDYGLLNGIWYYITNLNAGGGELQGHLNLKIYAYGFDLLEWTPIEVEPERIGWNYIDMSGYDIYNYLEDMSIGFSWDGLTTASIGVDSTYTFGSSLSYSDGSWSEIEDTVAYFIRPVFSNESWIPPIDTCYCSGLTVLTDPTGTFSDGSGDETYGNNCSCTWLIQPENATSVTLNITEFETEPYWDSLYIYDGTTDEAELLGSYNGSLSAFSVTSSAGSVFLKFVSDFSISYAGWEISYTSEIPVGVVVPLTLSNWKVYPNPGDGLIYLETNSLQLCETSVEVLNTMGQMVAHKVVTTEKNKGLINISDQPQGLYYIRLSDDQGSVIYKYSLK